jgi:hypothetical protein
VPSIDVMIGPSGSLQAVVDLRGIRLIHSQTKHEYRSRREAIAK